MKETELRQLIREEIEKLKEDNRKTIKIETKFKNLDKAWKVITKLTGIVATSYNFEVFENDNGYITIEDSLNTGIEDMLDKNKVKNIEEI